MTDPRFFRRHGPFSLGALAEEIGAEPPSHDTAALMIDDLAALETAGSREICVFNDRRYLSAFAQTQAGAVVTSRKLARHAPSESILIFAADPRLAYAQIGHLF